jgi:hypothetical protein
MAKEIRTSIDIQASPETVWQILMDFNKYSKWNSFIKSIDGEAKKESTLEVQLQGMIFKPKVVELKHAIEFSWLGKFWIKGLFDGRHSFQIKELEDGTTRFIHSECFKGLLVNLLWKSIGKETEDGFRKMNEQLKARAEADIYAHA